MFHSSSSPYNDPAFYCSAGPPPLTGTFNPCALLDATATAATLSSSPPFSSSSLPSNNYFMHQSTSTHHFTHHHLDPSNLFLSSSPPSSAACCDLLDFHSEPVRRVFSTGDLQGMNCLPGSGDNSTQGGAAVAAAAGRVEPYSAEERMKRIERYRSKRNQRNFQKKITYACRKTLADSRPRVRGRFARNGEMEAEAEAEASEISYESYNNHNAHENRTSYSNYDNGGNAGEWWRQMQAALTTTGEEEECCYDEDLWASIDSVLSMNPLS